jgi:hypothetical protein
MANLASETNGQDNASAITQDELPISPNQSPPSHSPPPLPSDPHYVWGLREWKLSDLVPVAITLLNGIGWVVIYLFSSQADQSKAQTKLFDEQLARLQSANQKLLDQLEIREKGSNSNALLAPGRDYSTRTYRSGMFQPGSSGHVGYSIEILNSNLLGSKIYYWLQWSSATDPLAVSTAAKLLGKQASATELKSLSSATNFLVGTITFSR